MFIMTKKIMVLAALFVFGLGFGFNSAEASVWTPEQITSAIEKTDAQNRPLCQIMVFDRDDLYVAYDVLVERGHKITLINGHRVNSRDDLATVPAIKANNGYQVFRIRYTK